MAEISGRGGEVQFGASSSQIIGIKSWTLNYQVDVHDTTDFDDGQATNSARTFTPGLSGASGTFEGYKDGAPQGLTFATALTLNLLESQTASQQWSMSAYITGLDINTPVDDVVTYSYTFQVTGEVTEPAA